MSKIDLPKFGRSAEFRSTSFDESDNTIEVIWTTGAAVRRRDWRSGRYYQEVLEMSPTAVRLERLNAGAPFLDTHNDAKLAHVLGSVVPGSARVANGLGTARIKLSRAAEDAAIVEKIKDGIIRNISVGYAIHKVVKTDNGGDGVDDEWRVMDWEPLEISAVPVPADAGSQIRKDERELTACEFVNGEDTRSAADIRAAMQARQAAAAPVTGLLNIARRELEAGTICEDFLASLTAAEAAAREHADPVAAAEAAWEACRGMAREDRVAAYAAAFALAAA